MILRIVSVQVVLAFCLTGGGPLHAQTAAGNTTGIPVNAFPGVATTMAPQPPQNVQVPQDIRSDVLRELRRVATTSDRLFYYSATSGDVRSATAASDVVVRTGDYLRVDVASSAHTPALAVATSVVLPTRYIGVNATGTDVLYLRPVIDTAGSRLTFDPARPGVLTGRFLVGLEDSLAPVARKRLARPVRMQIAGSADVFAPNAFTITHTNLNYVTVNLELRPANTLDTVRVRLLTEVSPEGLDFSLPVHRPSARIEGPVEVNGFGLEKAEFNILTPVGLVGDLSAVSVTTTRGLAQPRNLAIASGSIGEFTLRASGLRPIHINVSAPPLADTTWVIDPKFPWSFLIAAILGGVLGGWVRSSKKRTGVPPEGTPAEPPTPKWKAALGRVPLGLMVVVAYTVGVNLGPLPVPNVGGEAMYFTLAALAAALGPTLSFADRLRVATNSA